MDDVIKALAVKELVVSNIKIVDSGGVTNTVLTTSADSYFLGDLSIGATATATNVILGCESTTKAFQPPRMTSAQRIAIGTPSAGMIVYDTDLNHLVLHTGAGGWIQLAHVP
jgi:hypothetical protein